MRQILYVSFIVLVFIASARAQLVLGNPSSATNKYVNVAVEVSLSKAGDLKLVIAPGQRHILLLNQKLDVECHEPVSAGNTTRHKSDRELEKYLKLSCYQLEADSIIAADPDEVKAIRALSLSSQRSKPSSSSGR